MIKVVLHRILVRRDKPEDTEAVKTKAAVAKAGLALPDWVDNELAKKALREDASMDKGVVVDIGPTAFNDYKIASPIVVGDYISFVRFGGKDVVDPETDETLTVIQDEDVVAILTGKKEG